MYLLKTLNPMLSYGTYCVECKVFERARERSLICLLCRMGTHPSGPSYITSKDVSLKSWIEEHEAALGKVFNHRFMHSKAN